MAEPLPAKPPALTEIIAAGWLRFVDGDLSTGGAQALLIPCTDFEAVDLIAPLERDLGTPVLTSNQATMWHALRLAGIQDGVPGFGRLMDLDLA